MLSEGSSTRLANQLGAQLYLRMPELVKARFKLDHGGIRGICDASGGRLMFRVDRSGGTVSKHHRITSPHPLRTNIQIGQQDDERSAITKLFEERLSPKEAASLRSSRETLQAARGAAGLTRMSSDRSGPNHKEFSQMGITRANVERIKAGYNDQLQQLRAQPPLFGSTSVPSQSMTTLAGLATDLMVIYADVNGGAQGHGQQLIEGATAGEIQLQNMASGSPVEAVFPVYGAVKAGKSTFLSCVMRTTILPAQALPMTSVPIKISHVPGIEKHLKLHQSEKWNACLRGFQQKLKAGNLANEKNHGDEVHLYETQELVRRGTTFAARSDGDDNIASQLTLLSHFVRLMWVNDIDFETEYDISLRVQDLPEVQMDMVTFRDGPVQKFSFLDTPGPNEAKAAAALAKIGPQVMADSTGCIFCVPWDQVQAEQQLPLYEHICTFMAGKKVVVIVTKMDSFNGADSEKTSMEGIIRFYLQQTHVEVHFTSGWELLNLFDLQDMLGDQGSDAARFVAKLRDDTKLFAALTKSYNLEMSIEDRTDEQVMKFCRKLLGTKLEELNGEGVMEDFRQLYADSERLALSGRVASLSNAFRDLATHVFGIREYASAGSDRRREIQAKNVKIEEVFTNVLAELEKIPADVERLITKLLKTKVIDVMKEWAKTKHDICVVEVDEDAPPPADEFEHRLRVAGAKKGRLTCSLMWNNSDDLDLHCITPDGSHIFWQNKTGQGGELDVDRNRSDQDLDREPVENIFFAAPVPGTYKFSVQNYKKRGASTTPYTVRLTGHPDKHVPDLADNQEQVAFEIDWRGGGHGADGQPQTEVEFAGGPASLQMFLKTVAQPRFSKWMNAKFKEVMNGSSLEKGVVMEMKDAVYEKWGTCTTLLGKLEALDEADSVPSHLLVFKHPPEVATCLNIAEIGERICKFDMNDIRQGNSYVMRQNKCVLINAAFMKDVLKMFSKAVDDAAGVIRELVQGELDVVLQKFISEVEVKKDNAVQIREQNQAILEQTVTPQEVIAMLERVEPQLEPFRLKLEMLKTELASGAEPEVEASDLVMM